MPNINQRYAFERFDGYKGGLKNAGLPYDKKLVRYTDYTEQDAYLKTCELIEEERPTAIYCCSDFLAVGAFRAIEKHHLRVPEDISVAGFDGLIFDLVTREPLTTVRQPVYNAGRQLARRLLDRLKNPGLPIEKALIPPELVVRRSVGRAAGT